MSTILVIDDSESQLRQICEHLDAAGIFNKIVVAKDGLEGIRQLLSEKFDDCAGTVATDSSGNDIHGLVVEGIVPQAGPHPAPTWGRGISAESGDCSIQFDGFDDWVRVRDSAHKIGGVESRGEHVALPRGDARHRPGKHCDAR